MERQLQLIDGAQPARPGRRDEAVRDGVLDRLLPDMLRFLGPGHAEPGVRDDLTRMLDRCWEWHDGYKLTTALEDIGWTGSRSLVDLLDDVSGLANQVHQERVAAWVRDWDVRPRRTLGDTVTIDIDGRPVQGEIVGIDEAQAYYTVHCPALGHIRPHSRGTGTIGRCVPFETLDAPTRATQEINP